jgi:branched-chain amino acid transport system substrate-binding protein
MTLDGKPVTFSMQSEDDQADPKTGATVAQKLVDAKVAAVIGHLNSGVSIPASEIYSKAGIPMISGSATNPTLTERGMKTVFRTVGRDDQQGPAIASYIAHELKGKKVAIVDDKTAYGEGIANEVEKTLKADKVSIVSRERTTDKETDFKAILTKIKAKNPDVVFHGGMDATGGPISSRRASSASRRRSRSATARARTRWASSPAPQPKAWCARKQACRAKPPARTSWMRSRASTARSSSTPRTSTTRPSPSAKR